MVDHTKNHALLLGKILNFLLPQEIAYILITHENPNFYKRLFASNGVKFINRSYGYA